ncbi:MAG: hypothetical protein COV74_10400 [Candidatus Omnitrophica bacterium CG11_big_fil_rev_8_21_14_0_20_45_26]|uniref:DSP-PTPase phosphatase fused to NAD+ Kinase domain-containing protein n=1 Tax=Candidatus Abzuiibacterium crystallinum TaxID=1974748 RepID=A0A2H0LKQ3_9BACT|nr:MAG: hypothetical protein COV74_10400 [Candidatus Omnitrophica bacterium CG11_big_fil_rev_8_21_14_0_20_45_26]PIW63922.1 MAG: hypothetical protein COW12_08420 [Candidatus Omnitrophica bacterium CG12_big_fil_rev_8_21_14_0_65_45_16]
MKHFCFVVILIASLFIFAEFVLAKENPDLPHFVAIEPWLARGGQPTEAGLRQLRDQGYKTIINFRTEKKWDQWERKRAEALGMNYIHMPWSVFWNPSPDLFDQFFDLIHDPSKQPVFYHCKHGQDRTGTMSFAYYFHDKGLSEKEAKEKAFEVVKPNLRYRWLVNRRIKFFLKQEALHAEMSAGK